MRRFMFSAAVAVVVAMLALPAFASSRGSSKSLVASVGPGFTITMSKKTVKAGTYRIVVHDKSKIHNFHLVGPGVNKRTSVSRVYTTRLTVKLKKGTYKFVCDPHAAIMKGKLGVT